MRFSSTSRLSCRCPMTGRARVSLAGVFRSGQVRQGRGTALRRPIGWARLGLDDPERNVSRRRNLHRVSSELWRRKSGQTRSRPRRHFVLAYQYLTQGHVENAIGQLKEVVKLQPGDTLSAQLIAYFQPSSGTHLRPPSRPRTLAGRHWEVSRDLDGHARQGREDRPGDQGRRQFNWDASGPGRQPTTIAGKSTFAAGVLTLVAKGNQDGALVGKVAWQDADHFTFRLVGGPPTDPGLLFAR